MPNARRPVLDHLVTMTDDVGMFQHARFDVPNRSFGYCTDDVARALMVAVEATHDRATEQIGAKLVTTYLAFLLDAQLPDGWFHNFMGYDRRWQDHRGTHDSLERRVSTVGRIHPHLMVKIVDAEGRVVPRGQQGELLTRGYSVMKGYWDDAERTLEVIDESGWMHTGDLAILDAEGYCSITGRLKDMLIRGGENVYPREIEEFLYHHPKVQAVQVFGVPDPRYGEEVCAWVILRSGMTATCRGTWPVRAVLTVRPEARRRTRCVVPSRVDAGGVANVACTGFAHLLQTVKTA